LGTDDITGDGYTLENGNFSGGLPQYEPFLYTFVFFLDNILIA